MISIALPTPFHRTSNGIPTVFLPPPPYTPQVGWNPTLGWKSVQPQKFEARDHFHSRIDSRARRRRSATTAAAPRDRVQPASRHLLVGLSRRN